MRKSAAHTFYLAVFALFSGPHCHARAAAASASSSHSNPDVCAVSHNASHTKQLPLTVHHQLSPGAQVSDACASYADLDALNAQLAPSVRDLANNTDFFSYYRLNLFNKVCPFWNDENSLCGNIACAVTTLENEKDVPEIWRSKELGRLEGPKAQHPGRKEQKERKRPLLGELGEGVGESCVVEYDDECDDRDYCVPEDESASAKGDYVSLADNPERFTGYNGESAHQVWEAIYRENCFTQPSSTPPPNTGAGLSTNPFAAPAAQASADLQSVLGSPEDDECLEKRVFYRIISGMHASISTHLCHDYLNQTTGEWGPNLQCYKDRLHGHPDRISNLYFNYALVLRAVGKLRDYVQDYTFCTGDSEQDRKTKGMLKTIADVIPAGPRIFDESIMFTDPAGGISLKEDFRNRFRNVSRIMDCVGCDKCRLWGKVQTAGFGTALKVLFEFGEDGIEKPLLRRTELVALVNTLDKIGMALKALEGFRQQVTDEAAIASAALESDDVDDDSDNIGCAANEAEQQMLDESIGAIFRQELRAVWRAFAFVMKSWAATPKKVGTILLVEGYRLSEYWLGKPVRERSWELVFPTMDEL